MTDLRPDQPNPWHPYRDAWDKQRHETKPIFETSREWHDHLSALTWADQPKEESPMKMGDAFPSAFVKAEQIRQPVEVTIDRVELHEFDDGKKPVVYFRGKESGVVLNKSRFAALVELCQDEDSDGWKGHTVVLTTDKVMFAGKMVNALKFERSAKAQQPEPIDDDIPF